MKASSLLLILLFTAPISAQITITGLTEMQRGEVPGSDSTAISTAYNQVNIDFTQKGLQAGLRAEVYNTWGADRETYQITQKYARWNHGAARVEIGNYYAILGRGLTLRAFELPGVVLESTLYRLRYAPAQDLEGATASWTGNRVEAKALIGRSALSDIPQAPKPAPRHAAFPVAEIGPRAANSPSDSIPTSKLAARAFTSPPEILSLIKIGPGLVLPISTFPTFCKRPAHGSFYGEYAKRENSEKGTASTYPAMWAGAIWG